MENYYAQELFPTRITVGTLDKDELKNEYFVEIKESMRIII